MTEYESLREFHVDMIPIPKGRPRVYHGHAITPQRTHDAEKTIRDAYRQAYPTAAAWDQPLRLQAVFRMPDRRRTDIDNLLKLLLDALNGLLYTDDHLILGVNAVKRLPDQRVLTAHGRMRNRRPGDPLTWQRQPYEPGITIYASLISLIS